MIGELELGYAFSTCKSYFSSIEPLIDDIESNNIDKSKVLFVSAQEDKNEKILVRDCEVQKVTYSGLHLTPAIFLSENHQQYPKTKYWFLLPATVRLGSDFHKKVQNAFSLKGFENGSYPVINPMLRPTMDMGIVHVDHLRKFKQFFNRIKLSKYTDSDLKDLKQELILMENFILGIPYPKEIQIKSRIYSEIPEDILPPTSFMVNSENEIMTRFKKYKGKKLKISHFTPINLTKYQRTYRGIKKIVMNCDGGFPE